MARIVDSTFDELVTARVKASEAAVARLGGDDPSFEHIVQARTELCRGALARAAASDDPAEILVALLDAWGAHSHASIAELVVAAARRVREGRPERSLAASAAARHAQWMEVCEGGGPLDLDWLIDNLVAPTAIQARERMQQLVFLPHDPRIAIGLLALCQTKPLVTARPLWTLIFRAIRKQLAPCHAQLVAELSQLAAVTEFDRYLAGKLGVLRADLGNAEAPAVHDQALVDTIGGKLGIAAERTATKTEADFLAAIWAAPDDDGPRTVFADWLTLRGDARGELITLQVLRTGRRSAAARERKLIGELVAELLGPLESVIVTNPLLRFERGFVSRCEVAWRRLGAQPALMTHPAWATVREYKLSSDGERACDRWLDHMIALGAKRL